MNGKGYILFLFLLLPAFAFAGSYSFLAADGNYDRPADPTKVGHQLSVQFGGELPDSGALTVSARPPGSADFIEVGVFNSINVSEPIFVAFSGSVEEFRFNTVSILNSTTIKVTDTALDRPIGSFYGTE